MEQASSPTLSTTWPPADEAPAKRDAWQAIKRGLRCRCPNCGEGKLFRAYLKVADECSVCGQELSHHRADDLPAYLVIVIVGHIVVPIVLWIETNYSPSYVVELTVWPMITLVMSLLLLQPVKGAVVGLQWAFRMHGFDQRSAPDEQGAGELG